MMRRTPPALPGLLAALTALLAWLGVVSGAYGQAPSNARLVVGSDPVVAPGSQSGHGWVYLPPGSGDDGSLLHIVPRQGVKRASSGSVRLIMRLQRTPLAIAGYAGRAYLLIGPNLDDASTTADRQISSMTVGGPLTLGTWSYTPVERLELLAPLPKGTIPRSFAASGAGPVVVWAKSLDGQEQQEIALLERSGQWRVLTPPRTITHVTEVHALTTLRGLLIALREAGEAGLTLWSCTLVSDASKPAGVSDPQPITWTHAGAFPLPSEFKATPLQTLGTTAPHWLTRQGGSTILGSRTPAGLALWRLEPEGPLSLGITTDLGSHAGLSGTAGGTHVSLLGYTPAPPPAGGARDDAPDPIRYDRLRVVERSTLDGSTLADVLAHSDGLFSRRDFQLLWFIFIGVGIVVLLVVLRSESPQQITLPDGLALASPARRVIGGAIDLALALGITALIFGTPPAHWLSPAASASSTLGPLVCVLVVGFTLGTLGDGVVGASPGKLLLGVRVLGLAPVSPQSAEAKSAPAAFTVRRCTPAQAGVRNAVRWFMPPLGMMMAINGTFRHPGDMLARTVTVVRFQPDDEDPPASGEGE